MRELVGKIWHQTSCLIALGIILFSLQGCGQTQESSEEPIQTLPMKQLSLETMEAFQPTGQNWGIAGGVTSNWKVKHDLHIKKGTGILVNKPAGTKGKPIFTKWEHGDLKLEFDFLLPKGSDSGIYLMSRYEVQLHDSWNVEDPTFKDTGGINQQWDEDQQGFGGSAPRLNAARAPGLWQHMKILFKAPVFDQAGNKISNATFVKVWLNGVLVQKNVEVSGPTRAAPYQNEVAKAPLMIQGDHGPVAIRNIEYKRYDKQKIALRDLTYAYYPGEFTKIPDFNSLEPETTGTADSLAGNIITRNDRYALHYSGTLITPNAGTYLFKLRNAGMVRIRIDGKTIIDQSKIHKMGDLVTETVELESGEHQFSLAYLKHPKSWIWGLSLYVEGPHLWLQRLNSDSSAAPRGDKLPDLIVKAENRVKTLRSFAMHKGLKRTHVINVGSPNGINFSYDLGQSALLQAWEGSFLNTGRMWIGRGSQTAEPAGAPITFDGYPSVNILQQQGKAWPDSTSWDRLELNGYTISDQGWPVFYYNIGDVQVTDRFKGYDQPRRLVRTVHFKASEPQKELWFHLASGTNIVHDEDNKYIIDDRRFYLFILDTGTPEPKIVQVDEHRYGLRIPILKDGTEATIKYKIIW